MHLNRRSILFFVLTLAAVSHWLMPGCRAQAARPTAPAAPRQRPTKPAADKCEPHILGELILLGLAIATKTSYNHDHSRPCPDTRSAGVVPRQDPQTSVAPTPTPLPLGRLANLPAAEALRTARLLCLLPRSHWFNREKLERELLRHNEFGALSLELTRSTHDADLVLEVTRKVFTTRFTCAIIEPYTRRVLASTTATSLGGEIEPHLAEAIIKQFKIARGAQEKKED